MINLLNLYPQISCLLKTAYLSAPIYGLPLLSFTLQAQGNTQIYVNWTAISLLEYMIPSKEEQVKIGEYLHSISNLINLHQSKLEKLQKIKNSMLESMFV